MASHPTKIGRYDVEGIIGRGGMGVVYKAMDSQLSRHVAIKMILSEGDQTLLERFRSEARSTGALQCPNIVTVYEFGEHNGNPYLVMQYLDGESLESMIRKGLQLTISERLKIIIGVCNGLSYAHKRGVIHRDIKPANIMVLPDGTAVIVDFGIARLADSTRVTGTNQVIGSALYMSPEQLQAKDLDNRTDIYSTGIVMYQLLTGCLPFNGSDMVSILFKIVSESAPPLSKYLKEYPTDLDGILGRALAVSREERYADSNDLAFDLKQVQQELKAETMVQLMQRADAAIERMEWTTALEQLKEILRIDAENARAQHLMSFVREHVQRERLLEQARALKVCANDACKEQRYDEALRLVDQALQFDVDSPDLVQFRQSIEAAKQKNTFLRRLLRRTEAALEDGDLHEAKSAVDEALGIDANDTRAKTLSELVARRIEEYAQQQQLGRLLDYARTQLAVGDFSGALQTLSEAERLDANSTDVRSLQNMAAESRDQHLRALETQELKRRIERAMMQQDYTLALNLAETGLQKFSQERSLLKLKELAVSRKTLIEQQRYVEEQHGKAVALAEAGQLQDAISILDAALQRVPSSGDLESLRLDLRTRLEAEAAERQKYQAIGALVEEVDRLLKKKGTKRAKEFLQANAKQYTEVPKVQEAFRIVQEQEELEALESKLASESHSGKRIALAEEALRFNPENLQIRQRRNDLRELQAKIRSAIDALEKDELFADAVKELKKLRKAHPRAPEFEAEIRRLESLAREKKAAKTSAPVTKTVATELYQPAQQSATQFLNLPSQPYVGDESVKPDATNSDLSLPAVTTFKSTERKTEDSQGSRAAWLAGPWKYLAIAAVVLVFACVYVIRRHGMQTKPPQIGAVQVHIATTPSDAAITSSSQSLVNGVVSLTPGGGVVIEVTRLGYKAQQVEIRQQSDGNIVLEPEPLHVSIHSSLRGGTVQLDDTSSTDLSQGNIEDYPVPADANFHTLIVAARGRKLLSARIRQVPGSLPEINDFNTNDLFLVTTLGSSAKLYAGGQLRNLRFGDRALAPSLLGTELSLSEPSSEIAFGNNGAQSVPVASSSVPMLLVYSVDLAELQITSNVSVNDAILKVEGTRVQSRGGRWLVSRPPGTYTFEISANGYDLQSWKMTVKSGQGLVSKNVNLTPSVRVPTKASLEIIGGTPEAQASVDDVSVGSLDASGNLQRSDLLSEGHHTLTLSKKNCETRAIAIDVKLPRAQVKDATLTPWPIVEFQTSVPNVTVKLKRKGDSQEYRVSASDSPVLRPGEYDLVAEAEGFQQSALSILLKGGETHKVPLSLESIKDFEFQDPTQLNHSGEWLKSKDSHKWIYLRPGHLNENLVFAKPGKILFVNKKIEWLIESVDGSARLQYVLDGSKITRKLVIGDQVSDTKEFKADLAATGDKSGVISLHIRADGPRVSISSDKRIVIDDYSAPNQTFAGARIGIRTDSDFLVRK